MTFSARFRIASVLAVLAASVAAGPAVYASTNGHASEGKTTAAPPVPPPMYGDASGAASQVVTVGSDQCGLPADQRTGAWACVDPTQTAPSSGSSASGAVAPDALSPDVTANGWCNYEGCWNVVDGLHANNQSNLEFGYGPTTLGTGKLTAKHSINGSQMQTYTTFRASIPTQAIYAEGNLLRGDPSTVGSVVDGQIQYEYKASLAAATTWHPKLAYQSDYYNSYDTQYTNHSNVIQYSWEVAGYPGFWWAYQEGCIAHDLDNNKYQFEDSENLFKDPAGSGWNS